MKGTRYSEAQIIKILKEIEVGVSVAYLSRQYGFGNMTPYQYKALNT